MRNLLGLILIISGIILGFYVGFWVMFIGGACDIIETFKADVFSKTQFGLGVLKCILAQLVGFLSFIFVAGSGVALMKD